MAGYPTAPSKYPGSPAKYPASSSKYPGSSVAAYPSGIVQVMVAGDSISRGANSTDQGGWRQELSYYIYLSGLGIDLVGSQAQFGTMPDPDNCCLSGASSATIATNATNDINTFGRIRTCFVMMGTNNIVNLGQNGATAAADVYAKMQTIQNAGMAKVPAFQIIWGLVIPIAAASDPTSEFAALDTALTTPTTGYIDQFKALYPSNQPFVVDTLTAMGGVYTPAYMNDNLHPNDTGHHTQLANVYLSTTIRTHLRSIAPRINTLGAAITSPAGGTTITYGVATIITGTITRSSRDCTVVLKKGSTTVGTATFADVNSNVCTYSWSPLAGDAGAQSLTFQVTDNISSEVATSAAVNVTVVAPVSFNAKASTILTDVTVLRDWFADNGVTIGTGVSSWADFETGATATQATGTAQPAQTASDATLNNKGTIHWDGVDDSLLDATLNLPAPGTTNIWIYGVCKQRTWTSGDHFWGNSSTAYRFGQLAVASPQVFFSNGTISGSASPALNTWFRYEIFLSASTSDYMKVGATTVNGGAGGFGNTDPAANFFIGSRNAAGFADCDHARLTITQGKSANVSTFESAMLTYYNNIPAV